MNEHKSYCNSYDIDGVIYLGSSLTGLTPRLVDIIITGRSFEEEPETNNMLQERSIKNKVYYNNIPFDEKTREKSGYHKANTINKLLEEGYDIGCHFEDDPVQIEIIKMECPGIKVISIGSFGLINLENERHL